MYDPSRFLILNNYGYSDEQIAVVKEYLKNKKFPPHVNNSAKTRRFIQKWSDFKIVNDKLFYIPLNLEVVPNDKRNEILLGIYKDITKGVGQGIDMFYHRIVENYLNIRRKDVEEFLKSQKVYQITRPQNHKMNKPILATSPNERWGIDCINMTSYASSNGGIDKGHKFILTCVDYFTRKVWLRAMKKQTAKNVTSAMKSIVAETKTYPNIIQADNGTEFLGETTAWMKENNIVYIKTLSYTPTANGLVEGKNKIVRKILREIMIRNNSQNWVNYLQICSNNMNSQRNGTTKQTPDSLWKEGHEIQGEKNESVIQLHKKRIAREVQGNTTEEYKVGDYVRVKMGSLFSEVRKMIKAGDKKLITVTYSPDIYQIASILKKDLKDEYGVQYEKQRYTLKTMDGVAVDTQQKQNNPDKIRRKKRFFASEFQKVTNPNMENSYLENFSVKDALKLNKQDDPNPVTIERALPRTKPIIKAVLPLPLPKIDPLIGREIKKTFKNHGTFVGVIQKFEDPYYFVVYTDGDEEDLTRAQIMKLLIPIETPRYKNRIRKEVIIGGKIHFLESM